MPQTSRHNPLYAALRPIAPLAVRVIVAVVLVVMGATDIQAQSAYSSRKDSIKAATRISAAMKNDTTKKLLPTINSAKAAVSPEKTIVADSTLKNLSAERKIVADSVRKAFPADGIAKIKKENDSLYADDLRRVMLMDSIQAAKDSIMESEDSARVERMLIAPTADTPVTEEKPRDWLSWRPNPQKALWLALVLPGGGQIYNRKYWKLPIIYGGIVGCIYAMSWNNMMYKDYSQAYLDIMDSDPNTQSYNQFLHLGKQITPANEERYKQIFKSRKDKYRRWRDLSFFCLLGVYAISIIDAYVDAELSQFDISPDLSLKVQPTVVGATPQNGLTGESSLGVNCTLNF